MSKNWYQEVLDRRVKGPNFACDDWLDLWPLSLLEAQIFQNFFAHCYSGCGFCWDNDMGYLFTKKCPNCGKSNPGWLVSFVHREHEAIKEERALEISKALNTVLITE